MRRCGGVGTAASDVRLDVVLGFGEEGAEVVNVEDGAEGFEVEDEVRIGDAESVGAVGRNVNKGMQFAMCGGEGGVRWGGWGGGGGGWGGGGGGGGGGRHVGFERFEAAGFWMREREGGLLEGRLGNEKAKCN